MDDIEIGCFYKTKIIERTMEDKERYPNEIVKKERM